MKKIDYTNQRIGKLTVLHEDYENPRTKSQNVNWLCRCDCGNYITLSSAELKQRLKNKYPEKTSCGKCHAQMDNLIGNKYGKLTVIDFDREYDVSPEKKNWQHKWICQCECGNIVSVLQSNLKRGHTQSCGCINYSIGEKKIEDCLIENNINYIKEYSFKDLKDKGQLRFDFAIFDKENNLIELIEFDGRQHFLDYTPWNGSDKLEDRKRRDEIKNEYCKNNNLKLIRISYKDLNKINLKILELDNNE